MSTADELAKLIALRDRGELSAYEFESEKAKLLGSSVGGEGTLPPPSTSGGSIGVTGENGRGARILVLVLVALGVLLSVGGILTYFSEASSNQTCNNVNNFLNGVTTPVSCSATASHVAFVIFLVGLALIALAVIIRVAERRTR